MAYTIYNTNGTILLLLPDGQVDKSATSLTLVGRNYASYGQEINNNFVKLLANSANSSGSPPRSPLTGQLWYDTTIKRLKIYDNGFKTVGAVNVSSTQPSLLQTGDLWFDSSNNQLKIYSSGFTYNIGPAFSSAIGETGLIPPSTTITDQDNEAKGVILLKSYGTTVGLVYYDDTGNNSSFDMDSDDLNTYAPNASTSTVVSGVTLIGDLSVSGKITNNHLSISVDIDTISPFPYNDALSFGGILGDYAASLQNPQISSLLDKMFPANSTTLTNTTTVMPGIILGTQARVLCRYTRFDGATTSGYQVRVFRTVGTHSTSTWQPYYFTTATIGGSDVSINYVS